MRAVMRQSDHFHFDRINKAKKQGLSERMQMLITLHKQLTLPPVSSDQSLQAADSEVDLRVQVEEQARLVCRCYEAGRTIVTPLAVPTSHSTCLLILHTR